MQTSPIIETRGLTKRFGERVAVDHVDLAVPRGSAYGFLGHNGAGKTTLIRMLLGLTRASAGGMSLVGRPVPSERAQALARVGAIVEEPSFHPHLTGVENMRVVAAVRGPEAYDRIDGALARVGLSGRANDLVRGEHAELHIGVDDPSVALELLEDHHAVTAARIADGDLLVTLRGADGAAAINADLVGAGVAVSRLEPVRESLEHRFLEITSRLGVEA